MFQSLLLGFGLFVSTSTPQGKFALDTPSGLSIEVNNKYFADYSLIISNYRRSNYEIKICGIGLGKELMLWNHFSILPEVGTVRILRERRAHRETGFSPVFSIRFLYLFPSDDPRFQIGFTLKEIFDEEIDTDFLDIGIGFRL